MAWQLTDSLDEFERAAGPHLLADPVRQTVPLTVLASLRHTGLSAFGDDPPILAWHSREDGTVDGAVLQTPPYPLLLVSAPAGCLADLLTLLAAEHGLPAAVNLDAATEEPFLAAWSASTGGCGTARMRTRLFRLDALIAPDPAPAGLARVADPGDTDLLVQWADAFARETDTPAERSERMVADRLSHRGLMLWEVGGQPVAMAGTPRPVAGVARVIGVYTSPEHRRRGYGAAVTTAVTQAVQAAGATDVVLFTDLANPTSNGIYQRLGYRPVEDRVLLELTPGVTSGPRASS
jgi:RimJ/RimL family protein N-acetyltransferase